MRNLIYAILIFVCASSALSAGTTVIEPFRLPDINDQVVEVSPRQETSLTVVCFLGTECPLAKLYATRLQALANNYADRGVRFIGINSNRQDSLADLRRYGEQHGLEFPLVKDFQNVVADSFHAERTPEVFVLDRHFTVRYRGRIDDQYLPGIVQPTATQHDLRQAIDELLVGKAVTQPRTAAPGCIIGRVREPIESSETTYCNQIARVFQRHCIECHRDGEIGPFALSDYEEAVGWADTILEVIADGRMPPWHANPAYGDFVNARQMPEKDKRALQEWVAAGMPYGDPEQLPAPLEFTPEWRLPRQPDMVLAMGKHAFTVPAEGTVEYQYFVVDPGFTEDKWVTGAQVIPGNRSVVHHSIVFVRPPDGARFRGVGWVGAYVPGQVVTAFPPGSGLMVPAGSKFVFQQHYTPTGSVQQDLTKVGLMFGNEADITHEIYTILGIDQEFEIPPGADHHVVHAPVRWLPHHAKLLSINPHMHVRGKSFRLFAHSGEKRQTLLEIPHYDFNWQHSYRLRKPLPLSAIDRLEFEAVFDNSASNPVNPDPSQHVTWGDQTWEEMAVAFFEVSEPRVKPDREAESNSDGRRHQKDSDDIAPAVRARMAAEADRMLTRFDKNQDGLVGQYETPWVFRRYSFHEIDRDQDGQLTREEIEAAARWRVK